MPTGEVGELIIRAPQLMLEYWNNPLETSEALRTYDEGGMWLHTGDLAYMDEEGYVFLVDRKKDLMKTSGFQVWPREIEEVLSAHPAVLEVGVAGVPDAVKGEVAKAWVVLKAGERRPRTSCAPTAASGSLPTRCRHASSSEKSFRRRWSGKSCGACWPPNPDARELRLRRRP